MIIERLREYGPKHEETAEFLDLWIVAGELEAMGKGTPRANAELDMKRGKVYAAAGFFDAARDSFEAVRIQANQQPGDEDLFAEAERLLDELDAAAS